MVVKIKLMLLSTVLVLACSRCTDSVISEEDCYSYDYSDCNSVEPFSGELKIRLTLNADNSFVPVKIFRGTFDQGELIYSDTARESEYTLQLEADQYYSGAAYYKSGEEIVIAADGDEIKKKSRQVCDSVCWTLKNGEIDLRLK